MQEKESVTIAIASGFLPSLGGQQLTIHKIVQSILKRKITNHVEIVTFQKSENKTVKDFDSAYNVPIFRVRPRRIHFNFDKKGPPGFYSGTRKIGLIERFFLMINGLIETYLLAKQSFKRTC